MKRPVAAARGVPGFGDPRAGVALQLRQCLPDFSGAGAIAVQGW